MRKKQEHSIADLEDWIFPEGSRRHSNQLLDFESEFSMPDSYYEDPLYKKYQLRLKLKREAYNNMKKTKGIGITHSKELNQLRRSLGSLEGIIRMVESGQSSRQVAYQLKAVSTVLRKTALSVLRTHYDRKLDKNEADLTARAIINLLDELKVISKIPKIEIEEILEKLKTS